MERFLTLILENPILGVVFVSLIASLIFTVVKKLFKLAVGLGIIIIALAIVLHFFGYDSLPQEGKELIEKAVGH
ncbi:MAG: hypothetical protein JXA28_09860 [Bacteroidetes bacterium]|nr:hypothetical protein [Bacteroidota bacterium]